MNIKIDESKCPLCSEVNLCAEVAKKAGADNAEPCWCHDVDFPPKVLDAVPIDAKRKACICQQCIAKLTLAKAL
jgi:hypothetical protein